AAISETEIDYILGSVNAYFAEKTTREDVVWTFSGVRPLFDDMAAKTASAVTRDYAFDVDRGADDRAAPLLSIYGGKLTTYRKLAEHAMEKLAATFPSAGPAWTREASLPGGESGYARWPETVAALQARYGFLDAAVFDRMVGAYGEALVDVLGDAQSCEALGRDFGGGLYAREVDYLCAHEFARTADDILWRRTKLGLSFSDDERRSLTDYLAERRRDAA
ncbi:MAG: glycerol-3-phosphate dehydrogenase C-terminal domain-containing protein, partial [Pseudomonadota bacterium]